MGHDGVGPYGERDPSGGEPSEVRVFDNVEMTSKPSERVFDSSQAFYVC